MRNTGNLITRGPPPQTKRASSSLFSRVPRRAQTRASFLSLVPARMQGKPAWLHQGRIPWDLVGYISHVTPVGQAGYDSLDVTASCQSSSASSGLLHPVIRPDTPGGKRKHARMASICVCLVCFLSFRTALVAFANSLRVSILISPTCDRDPTTKQNRGAAPACPRTGQERASSSLRPIIMHYPGTCALVVAQGAESSNANM